MSLLQRLTRAALGAALIVLAAGACGDGSGPVAELQDPGALQSEADAVDDAFQTPQFRSLEALDGLVDFTALPSPGLGAVAALVGVTRPSRSDAHATPQQAMAARAQSIRRLLSSSSASASPSLTPPVIPGGSLGVTYEWDEVAAQYADFGTPGAPANGVRFVLYAVDPFTGEPASPLNSVGYVDIIDQGNASTSSLRVVVVGDDAVTYADYDVTATAGTSSFTASSDGYITDGTRRLDFNVSLGASGNETDFTADFNVTLDLNTPAVLIDLSFGLTATPSTLSSDIDFIFERSGETVRTVGTLTVTDQGGGTFVGTANLRIEVNGHLFATITSNGNTTTIVGGDGEPLTNEELAAVQRLFQLPDEVFDEVFDLLDPAFDILNPNNTGGF